MGGGGVSSFSLSSVLSLHLTLVCFLQTEQQVGQNKNSFILWDTFTGGNSLLYYLGLNICSYIFLSFTKTVINLK